MIRKLKNSTAMNFWADRRAKNQFARDEDGSVIAMTLMLFVVMLVLGGMAVDFMRYEARRVNLQDVSDRAVLAAASLRQTQDSQAVVESYFESHGYNPSTVIVDGDYATSPTVRKATVTSVVDVPTIYLRFLGIDELEVAAQSAAIEGVGKVEISLVLDISLSMSRGGSGGDMTAANPKGGRIEDLRVAAVEFAETVLDPKYNGAVSLNIIPYAGHVNPGPEMAAYLNGQNYEDIYHEVVFDAIMMGTQPDADGNHPRMAELNEFGTGFVAINEHYGEVAEDDEFADLPPEFDDYSHLSAADFEALKNTVLRDSHGNALVNGDGDVVLRGDIRTFEKTNGDISNLEDEELIHVTSSGVPYFKYYAPIHCVHISDSDFEDTALPTGGQDYLPHYSVYGGGRDDWEFTSGNIGWNNCPTDDSSILYALQEPQYAVDYIEGLRMFSGTGTEVAVKWGLALLDPDSNTAFRHLNTIMKPRVELDEFGDAVPLDEGDPASLPSVINAPMVPHDFVDRPAPWDDTETKKILIVMTDGGISPNILPADYNRTMNILDDTPSDPDDPAAWRGQTTGSGNRANVFRNYEQASRKYRDLCEIVNGTKSADPRYADIDIETYAIAFELVDRSRFQTADGLNDSAVLEQCSSQTRSGRFFYTTSGTGISAVFQEIAERITDLRLEI